MTLPGAHAGRMLFSPRFVNTTDGDLWQLMRLAIAARGEGVTNTCKVKSHLSEDAVAKGLIARHHYEGNKRADEAAGRGSRHMLAWAH
eukprot:11482552-Alexandrium_andersonii.AAC.1